MRRIPPDSRLTPYAWIDEYILRVRPYLFVRTADNLLIKRPNQAVKLNRTATVVLAGLLDGMSIAQLFARLGNDTDKIAEVGRFITAVREHCEGRLDPLSNPAADTVPFTMEFSRYPVLSEIALTYRCNLACAFCYAGCNCTRRDDRSNEMNAGQVSRIIDTIMDEAHVPSVSFTGGEPTLTPTLLPSIKHAKKRGMRVNLISNGTLIDARFAGRLADSGLDSVQISLEGVSSTVHDGITGCRGAFDKSVAAVKYCRDTGINTHTNATLTALNMAECRELPRFVKNELGCSRFSLNLMIPAGSGAINRDLAVRYSELSPFIREMIDLSAAQGVEFMWYSPVPMCLFNTVAHGLGNKGCAACDGLLSVSPTGEVLPCSSCADSVGNLLRQDFETVWNSERARYYHTKEFAHERCRSCGEFALCNGACPLYWREFGYAELEEVFRHSSAAVARPENPSTISPAHNKQTRSSG
jgi:radical SAM protein with 4Fe4S-binding SPASM domain